eukprot:gnl/MRDRNA2_/MRDRNA2_93998_c0_seq1.p2 gnl/MRDRNA2_/MRDRNA2_93998_c0~~gnl/MRDRNA2_/MRDRNA2_93998_c0_seq1.p2  ORF type:complete len:226 (+),score=37.83 gnl/MRDRNA2_/MRDRNA2_93998_c0_seq1:32-709(+)
MHFYVNMMLQMMQGRQQNARDLTHPYIISQRIRVLVAGVQDAGEGMNPLPGGERGAPCMMGFADTTGNAAAGTAGGALKASRGDTGGETDLILPGTDPYMAGNGRVVGTCDPTKGGGTYGTPSVEILHASLYFMSSGQYPFLISVWAAQIMYTKYAEMPIAMSPQKSAKVSVIPQTKVVPRRSRSLGAKVLQTEPEIRNFMKNRPSIAIVETKYQKYERRKTSIL